MKIKKSPPTINSFGGINFVVEALKRQGIPQLVDSQLGSRPPQADYSYGEVLLGHCCATLCGAERLEDAELLRPVWGNIPGFRLPSSDTTGRVLKSLSVRDQQIETDNALHRINSNPRLNRLLLETSCHLGILNSSEEYVLDYDNLILDHEKFDSQKTYKFNYGSQPGVALIGETPVFVQGRTGNSPAKLNLADTLRQTFALLDGKQVNLITGDANTSLGIITNDREMDEKELIEFYNQRGAAETNFDVLNNDFNWSRLPFSDLCGNTVFLITGAICKVIYKYIIETFSKALSFLKPSFRLENFLFHFMVVPAKWIRTGGR